MKGIKLAALAFAIALSVTGVTAAHAAPAEAPYCYRNAATTADMAGKYFAPDIPAAIEVNACGGVQIVWDNASGRHNAYYGAIERVPGGGFIARADEATGGVFPNGADLIVIKPAELGKIQLITTNAAGNFTGVYPLTKVS